MSGREVDNPNNPSNSNNPDNNVFTDLLANRLSRLLEYIETSESFRMEAGTENDAGVPWGDLCLDLRQHTDIKGQT